MTRRLALVALLLFAALLGVSLWLLTRQQAPASFAMPVRPAPEFNVGTLEGGQVSLAAMKGKPYLVNFWATWCAPCKAEHPFLIEMAKEGVPILGMLYRDPNGRAAELLEKDGNPFTQVGLDPIGDQGLNFGISGVPDTFLVDASGTIVKTIRGPISNQSQMDDMVGAWKAEAAKAPAGG